MNDENYRKYRKYWLLALFGLFIAFIAYAVANEALNQQIAFEVVKNNTDLCNFNHTSMLCDGIRQNNVTYYTNNTTIVLYVFAHASAAAQTAGVFLYRDDILLEAQSGRPLAAPEQTWRGITAIIPRNSSYRVNFTDFHHFEWYEDQILSGRNGTLSINQTGGGTGSQNLSQVLDQGNDARGRTINNLSYIRNGSNMYIQFRDTIHTIYTYLSNGTANSDFIQSDNFYEISYSTGGWFDFVEGGFITNRRIESKVATGTSPFVIASTTNNTNLNADLIDGYHYDDINSSINLKVNKSGDNMTGDLTMNNNDVVNTSGFSTAQSWVWVGSYQYGNYSLGSFATSSINNVTYFYLITNRILDKTGNIKNGSFPERYAGYLLLDSGVSSSNLEYKVAAPNSTTQVLKWRANLDGNTTQTGTIQSDNLTGTGNRPLCANPNGVVIICP